MEAASTTTSESDLPQQDHRIIEMSDVKFEVEGHTVHASKTCLALQSPVLHTMFHSEFIEKSMDTIPLPGKSAKGFLEFVRVTHLSGPITMDNIQDILPIAMEYQCENILTSCNNVLVHEDFSTFHLALSGQYKLQRSLKKFIESGAMMEVKQVKQAEHFGRVPAEVLVQVYEKMLERKDELIEQMKQRESCENQREMQYYYLEQKTEKYENDIQHLTMIKSNFTSLLSSLETCKTWNWVHSNQCICNKYKGRKCTCREATCGHYTTSHITCTYQHSKNMKYPSGPQGFYYNFQLKQDACADCIENLLWHILEHLNNIMVIT